MTPGSAPSGTWQLIVRDLVKGGSGRIDTFRLTFATADEARDADEPGAAGASTPSA